MGNDITQTTNLAFNLISENVCSITIDSSFYAFNEMTVHTVGANTLLSISSTPLSSDRSFFTDITGPYNLIKCICIIFSGKYEADMDLVEHA